jgi:hypothetical protein
MLIQARSPSPPILPSSASRANDSRNGAVFGGWVALLVAIASVFVPFPTFWLYGPLILAAFICGIVAIAQGKAGRGIILLLCSLVLPPIAILIFWTAVLGTGSVLSHSTNFWSTLTNFQAAAPGRKDAPPSESKPTQTAKYEQAADATARSECAYTLIQIDLAKQQWALENRKQSTDTPAVSDLVPYLGGFPKCPSGGVYSIHMVGESPTCSISGHGIDAPGKSAVGECIDNLRLIDSAKQQWALEHRQQITATPTISDLLSYLGSVGGFPDCPSGGTYSIKAVGEMPTCSIPGHEFPSLPSRQVQISNEKIDAILGSTNLPSSVTNK